MVKDAIQQILQNFADQWSKL